MLADHFQKSREIGNYTYVLVHLPQMVLQMVPMLIQMVQEQAQA